MSRKRKTGSYWVLIGLVAIISCSKPTASENESGPNGPLKTSVSYDENGEVAMERHYTPEGLLSREMRFYNNGQKRSDIHFYYTADGQLKERIDSITGVRLLNEYDSLGRKAASREIIQGMSMLIRSYYTEDGKVRIDSTRKRSEATFYQLNDAGEILQASLVEESGDTLVHSAYSYDSSGRVVEEKRWEAGNLVQQQEYTYNDRGLLLTSANHLIAQGKKHRLKNTYDDEGRLVRSILRYGGGQPDKEYRYAYGNGERIEREWRDGAAVSERREVYRYYPADTE